MANEHNPAFLAIVGQAKSRITEITVEEVIRKQAAGEAFQLVDVREDREFDTDRCAGSIHIGKGVIERDVEKAIPERDTLVVLYCGGGYRSALATDALQIMGYTNVRSMAGGMRAWRAADGALETP